METFFAWAGGILSVIGLVGAAFAIIHRCSTIILNQEQQAKEQLELSKKVESLQEEIAELRKTEAKVNVIWEAVMKGAVGLVADRGFITFESNDE